MSTGTFLSQQTRAGELVDNLRADFQHRNEPNFAWKSAVSAFLALPGLRAFWPMSAVDYQATDQAKDLAGSGYHLTNNNTVTFGYDDLAPYAAFVSASSQYLSRADGGAGNWADIVGTEAFIVTPGLTLGGWFYIESDYGITQILSGKQSGVGANRSYILFMATGTLLVTFSIASGANNYSVASTSALSTGQWYLIIGRYTPSGEIALFINNIEYVNVTSIPASINDTAAAFAVGASSVPGNFMDGRASMVFLCASALSDAIIGQLYHQTRMMYGV